MQSFCWWCDKKLRLPHVVMVPDQLGHHQKVHKCCVRNMQAYVRLLTADITGTKPQQTDPLTPID